MREEESKEIARIIKFVSKNPHYWEMIYDTNSENLTILDTIELMETLLDYKMYQLALMMLKRLEVNVYYDKAIENVIEKRTQESNCIHKLISDCIEEIKIIMNKDDIANEQISM